MEFPETNDTCWNKGRTPRFFCTCFLFLYRHCSIQTVVLIRIHVLWLLALKSILLPKSSSPALWSSALLAANLAPVSHAGVGPAMWMAAWMLISRCNKVFEVCNTLLQNHNVKIPLWIGRLALLDTPGSPPPPPRPQPLSTTRLSHCAAPALPHYCTPTVPSPHLPQHLLIITSGRKTCLALIGLRWQKGFPNTNMWDVVIRGKKVREWTQQGGGWIIGLGEK